MRNVSYKRLVILLLAAVAVLAGCVWYLGWRYNLEQLDAKATLIAIKEFDRTRSRLDEMGVDDGIAYLNIYAHASSASGSRYLSMIMDREKTRMIHDIIQQLRSKTGDDLGSDPEQWIRKYSGTNSQKLKLKQK